MALLWSIDDTLQRGNASRAGRQLPDFSTATALLADAERDGLLATGGKFRSSDVRRLWPSPYGRAGKRATRLTGGVAPKAWNERIVCKLTHKFVSEPRRLTRDELRSWVGGVSFSDPERWTAYIRRAMAAAIIDILLRRQCRCTDARAIGQCEATFGRRFCLAPAEGARLLANVWSWRADGRIASKTTSPTKSRRRL